MNLGLNMAWSPTPFPLKWNALYMTNPCISYISGFRILWIRRPNKQLNYDNGAKSPEYRVQFQGQRWEFIKENKKTRFRPRKKENKRVNTLSTKKKTINGQEIMKENTLSTKKKKKLFFLIFLLVESVFSFSFLSSFINSHLTQCIFITKPRVFLAISSSLWPGLSVDNPSWFLRAGSYTSKPTLIGHISLTTHYPSPPPPQ